MSANEWYETVGASSEGVPYEGGTVVLTIQDPVYVEEVGNGQVRLHYVLLNEGDADASPGQHAMYISAVDESGNTIDDETHVLSRNLPAGNSEEASMTVNPQGVPCVISLYSNINGDSCDDERQVPYEGSGSPGWIDEAAPILTVDDGAWVEALPDGQARFHYMLRNRGGTTRPDEVLMRLEAYDESSELIDYQDHYMTRPIGAGDVVSRYLTIDVRGMPCTLTLLSNVTDAGCDDVKELNFAGGGTPQPQPGGASPGGQLGLTGGPQSGNVPGLGSPPDSPTPGGPSPSGPTPGSGSTPTGPGSPLQPGPLLICDANDQPLAEGIARFAGRQGQTQPMNTAVAFALGAAIDVGGAIPGLDASAVGVAKAVKSGAAGATTIGIGVSGEIAALVGPTIGTGFYVSSTGEIGWYITAGIDIGAVLGASGVGVATIVHGGPSTLAGDCYAVTVTAGFPGTGWGPTGGVQFIFNASGVYVGIAFEFGIGAGSPINLYLQATSTHIKPLAHFTP